MGNGYYILIQDICQTDLLLRSIMRGKATETDPGSFWIVNSYLIVVIISNQLLYSLCIFLFVLGIIRVLNPWWRPCQCFTILVRLKLVQVCISLHCLCFSNLMEHQQIQGFPYFAQISDCMQCLQMTKTRSVYSMVVVCTNRSEKILPVEQL